MFPLGPAGRRRIGLSFSDTGLWLRQGGEYGQTVIQAARSNLDGTQLYDVTFLTFGPNALPSAGSRPKAPAWCPALAGITGGKLWDAGPTPIRT